MKGPLRWAPTPRDARVPSAGGRPRRHSARKGGDGGAPTHHGERSARVGVGAGERLTESESLGVCMGRSSLQMRAAGSGVEVQPLGPPGQPEGKESGEVLGGVSVSLEKGISQQGRESGDTSWQMGLGPGVAPESPELL